LIIGANKINKGKNNHRQNERHWQKMMLKKVFYIFHI